MTSSSIPEPTSLDPMLKSSPVMNLKSFWHTYNRPLITLASALFIILGTLITIKLAKGYRPTTDGILEGTGLLAASSNPVGARILIDGKTTNKVTNYTINLKPGTYSVEIIKEGFTPWKKNLLIEPELVTTTDAHLFRSVPSLTPLTFSGATNLTPSPDGQKITFSVASPSGQIKPGLYLIELSDRPALFSRGTTFIAENPPRLDFKDAKILWSPDSSQIIAVFKNANYILDLNKTTLTTQFRDASGQLPLLLATWEDDIVRREKQLLLSLPEEMINIATSSAKNLYFSPNGEKLLYTATQEVTIPENLTSPLPATNSQPESRTLIPGNIYIYDLKEDKNFLILESSQDNNPSQFTKPGLVTDLSVSSIFDATIATQSAEPILQDPASMVQTVENFRTQYSSFPFTHYQWFPTSQHILVNDNGRIDIVEYDSTNRINLYQGKFEENFVYPWPNGTKLLILTNPTGNPELPPNLYAINLK